MTTREAVSLALASVGAVLLTFAAAGTWGWQGGCAAAGGLAIGAAVLLGVGDTPTPPPPVVLDDAGQEVDPREVRPEGLGPAFR